MKSWYLLRCQENTWRRTLSALNDSHVETCCPVHKAIMLRADKKNSFRQSEKPIFPGYIFAHFDPETIHTTSILKMYGARDFIRFGKDIATVPSGIVDGLKLISTLSIGIDAASFRNNITPEIKEILAIKEKEIRSAQLLKLVSNHHSLLTTNLKPTSRGLNDKNSS